MHDFRHNLTPVEVKVFLKTVSNLTEDLLIRFCFKAAAQCPQCGGNGLCHSGAVSLYSSRFDQNTHEIHACLKCGYKNLSTLITMEKL